MAEKLTCQFLGRRNQDETGSFHILRVVADMTGVTLFRFDDQPPRYGEPQALVSESIYRALEKADLVIADITNADPNVMYELGFAHALKKPVLPLVRRGAGQIPSDLSGYLYFAYDPKNPHELHSVVEEWIRRNSKGKSQG